MSAPPLVQRFSGTERAVHWTYAICFLVLLATGFIMYLPALSVLVPSRYILRQLHLADAFCLITVPALIALLGNRQALAADIRDVDEWDDDDRHWISDTLNGFPTTPGRFNGGQKLNAAFVGGSFVLFVVTGVIMALNIFTRILPDWLVNNASLIHDGLTWLALLAWLGHVFLAGIYPSTRESLRGMLTGYVRVDWARHHYPRWLAHQQASIKDAPTTEGARYNRPMS